MCQQKALGGRRCPSHTDPERVQAYNARRRELYALKKAKSSGDKVEIIPTQDEIINSLNGPNHSTSSGENESSPNETEVEATQYSKENVSESTARAMDAWADFDSVSEVDSQQLYYLGLDSNPQEGVTSDQAESGYFKREKVTGTLYPELLNEDTHKAFGFLGADAINYRANTKVLKQHEENASHEMDNMTDAEKRALSSFTSQDYIKINPVIHGLQTPEEVKTTHQELAEKVSYIDSALQKGPNKQRIIYRGMQSKDRVFYSHEDSSEYDSSKSPVHSWIDSKMPMGGVVEFDGYLSTSSSVNVAHTYRGTQGTNVGGVLYEIQTPEGVNVSEVSCYGDEQEILLPRNSKFMVIGVQKPDNETAIVQIVAVNDRNEILDGTNSTTGEN